MLYLDGHSLTGYPGLSRMYKCIICEIRYESFNGLYYLKYKLGGHPFKKQPMSCDEMLIYNIIE